MSARPRIIQVGGPRRAALGGIFWMLTVVFFVGQAIAQVNWTGTPFSLVHNTVSDLGTTACQNAVRDGRSVYLCSPAHAAINVAFVLTGLLILAGLALIQDRWPSTRLSRAAVSCLALAGIGKVVVGLVPWNVDLAVHTLGGLGFLVGDVGLVLVGLALRAQRRWAALALVLGAVGLFGLLTASAGIGVAERLADYPMFVWFVLVGAAAIRHTRSAAAATPLAERRTT